MAPGYGVRNGPRGAAVTKVGRNEPCPCGSGKKYKKCCMRKTAAMPWREKVTLGLIALLAIVVLGAVAVTTLRHSYSDTAAAGLVWSPEHRHWHRE